MAFPADFPTDMAEQRAEPNSKCGAATGVVVWWKLSTSDPWGRKSFPCMGGEAQRLMDGLDLWCEHVYLLPAGDTPPDERLVRGR